MSIQQELTWLTGLLCMGIPFGFFIMAVKKTRRRAYACPRCNRDVPPTAPNCPNCGLAMPDQDQAI